MPDELLPYLAQKIGFKKDSVGEMIFVLTIGFIGWVSIAYNFIKDYK